nr:hypothetical protein CFP56_78503 [Quercus suber]
MRRETIKYYLLLESFVFVAGVLHPFSSSLRAETKPTQSSQPSTPLIKASTAGLHIPRISYPLSALQDPATTLAFVAADP